MSDDTADETAAPAAITPAALVLSGYGPLDVATPRRPGFG